MQKLYIIKIGGNIIDNPAACKLFLERFAAIKQNKILIHGGGKIATQIAEKLGVKTNMIDGRRITDKPMLDVVTMVYGGLVNKNTVAQLQAFGCNAIGLTGADAGVIEAQKRPVKDIDYGYVGDIVAVNGQQLAAFICQNLVPVIAPLSFDRHLGKILNTNADTMASAVAVALADSFEVNLIYCFEKKGVLSDPNNDNSVIAEIDFETYTHHKNIGAINKGMIPKLDNAFAAMTNGVAQVAICHADELTEVIAENNNGTRLKIKIQ
jgi:acetylglutamate kinase